MNYRSADKEQLQKEYARLQTAYAAMQEKGLKLNISRGRPDGAQLDIAMPMLDILDSDCQGLSVQGQDLRNYGMAAGIPGMRELFAQMLQVPVSQVWLGNNSSLNMMFDVISRGATHGFNGCEPWGRQKNLKFLCPAPGYDRHFAITEYFGFTLITVPLLRDGPDMQLVEQLVQDETVKGIWCVPKYSNPTGITYSDETVRRFAALRPAAKDFKIMWDNAYCVHDVTDTPDTLLDLYGECVKQGTEDHLFMFASTSKITFAGSGVAAMVAGDGNIDAMKEHYSFQTIGPDKLNQLRHLLYLKDMDGVRQVMQRQKQLLAPKFTMCDEKLSRAVSDTGAAVWSKPNGGYFISVDVMPGCAKRVVQLCKVAGVTLTPAGASFPYGIDPQDSNIRLAPTFCSFEELNTAMDLFCLCILLAAAEKVLQG